MNCIICKRHVLTRSTSFHLSSVLGISTVIFIIRPSICLDFCEKLIQNNGKMLVHSPDRNNLFVVIEKNYWIVTESQTALELVLSPADQYNADFSNRMLTLFSVDISNFGREAYVGLYNVSVGQLLPTANWSDPGSPTAFR